jgi:hypothetical protein
VNLTPLPPELCPDCGEVLADDIAWEEPALLRHGGYGATRRTVRRCCPCGWALVVERSEIRP